MKKQWRYQKNRWKKMTKEQKQNWLKAKKEKQMQKAIMENEKAVTLIEDGYTYRAGGTR